VIEPMTEVVATKETITPHRPVKAANTGTMEPTHSTVEPAHPTTMKAPHAATMEASHAAATMPAKGHGVGRKIGNCTERHTGNKSGGNLAQHDTPPSLQFDLFSISQEIAHTQMTSLLSFSRTGESLMDGDIRKTL
jgi:hypothetical protein